MRSWVLIKLIVLDVVSGVTTVTRFNIEDSEGHFEKVGNLNSEVVGVLYHHRHARRRVLPARLAEPNRRRYVSSAICPKGIEESFARGGYIINQLELLAILTALLTFPELFRNRRAL